MATQTVKLLQKQAAEEYLELHPETDANVVWTAVEGLTATNVEDALKELYNLVQSITGGGVVTGVKGDAEASYRMGDVSISPADIGLGNVDNTSDLDKPVSTATQAAIDAAVLEVELEEGAKLVVTEEEETFVYTFGLYNKNGALLGDLYTIDLPLESVVLSVTYDKNTKSITIELVNGTTTTIPVADLIDGLVSESDFEATVTSLESEIASKLTQTVADTLYDAIGAADTALETAKKYTDDAIGDVDLSGIEANKEAIEDINTKLAAGTSGSFSAVEVSGGIVTKGQNMIEYWEKGVESSDTLAIGGIAIREV